MSNYTRWYRVGNVKLVHDSRTIEGTDTYWLTAGLNPGDLFTIDGAQFYEVDTITDNTHLTLKNAYAGVSAEDSAYSIIRNFTATMPADIAARTAELLGDFRKYIDTDMRSIHGKSAYELAIEDGYTGTQAQWLESLKAAGEWSSLRSEVTQFEDATDGRVDALETGQGTLSNLRTLAKTDIVSAVNETNAVADSANTQALNNASNIGTLASLTTDEQGSIVGAINELDKRIHYLRKWWDGNTGWDTLNTAISDQRNNQVRGKCLGEKPTAAQWDSIQKGTFDDMYLGDYWSGNGGWQIVHFNYFRDTCWYFINTFSGAAGKWRFRAQIKKPSGDLGEVTPNHVVVMMMNGPKLGSYVDSDHDKLAISHYDSRLYSKDTDFETTYLRAQWGWNEEYSIIPHIYSGLQIVESCDSSGYPTGYVHYWAHYYLPTFEQVMGYRPPCTDGKVYIPGVSTGGGDPHGLMSDTPVQFAYFRLHSRRRNYWGDPMWLANFGGPDSSGKQTVWAVPKWTYIGYRKNALIVRVTYSDDSIQFRPYTCIAGGSDMGV